MRPTKSVQKHFLILQLKQFKVHQSWKCSKSFWSNKESFEDLIALYILASSKNNFNSICLIIKWIPFMNKMNKRCPKWDPWPIPHKALVGIDL